MCCGEFRVAVEDEQLDQDITSNAVYSGGL